MSYDLWDKHRDTWSPMKPEYARSFILYMIEEIGEAITIIKKKGEAEIMSNPDVREHFVEEMGDVLMYFKDKSAEFLLQWAGPQYQYPLTEKQIRDRLINGANKQNSDTYIYKIILNETNKMIGTIELSKIDRINGTARVCRFLIGEEDLRGKGIGKTALQMVLEIGFKAMNLNSISLGVFDFNESAIKCYELVGFKKTKLIENARKAENGFWNLYKMTITREEWLNRFA